MYIYILLHNKLVKLSSTVTQIIDIEREEEKTTDFRYNYICVSK